MKCAAFAHEVTSDRSTEQTLGGLPIESCRAEKAATLSAIAKCRVVFTGSYHAGVFAYALGGSRGQSIYQQKFAGVAERFGTTPLVYTLANGPNQKNDLSTLYSLLNRAREAAPENRTHLLRDRGEQIMTNRFFKRMVFDQIRTMAPAGGRFRPCQRVEGGAYPAQYVTLSAPSRDAATSALGRVWAKKGH
jgi:hypothetical protein